MTPAELAAIRERAEGQAFAYSEMAAIGKGVGGLEIYRPDLYEDLEAWSRSTENDHADTALALLDHVDALRTRIETYDGLGVTELHDRLAAVRELHGYDTDQSGKKWCSHCHVHIGYEQFDSRPWPCPTIQALEGE